MEYSTYPPPHSFPFVSHPSEYARAQTPFSIPRLLSDRRRPSRAEAYEILAFSSISFSFAHIPLYCLSLDNELSTFPFLGDIFETKTTFLFVLHGIYLFSFKHSRHISCRVHRRMDTRPYRAYYFYLRLVY